MNYIALLSGKNLAIRAIQKRLKEVFGRFCIKVRYSQSFINIFAVKVELSYHLVINIYLKIVRLKKRDRD